MKNIGLKLKEKREEQGLSVEEVAEDLKMRPTQITSIEEGSVEEFKDVFYLKYFIRDYAKYLGLDGEKLLDEFNEYLFDITSKIPIELINSAKKERKEENEKASPYTSTKKRKLKIPRIIICAIVIIVLVIVGYMLMSRHKGNDFSDNNITYSIRR